MEMRGGMRDTRDPMDERYESTLRREMRKERYEMSDWSSMKDTKAIIKEGEVGDARHE
jgi:hypothetical protein